MEKSYRIKANVGVDQVLNVNLKQNIDTYEVLSLVLKREDMYRLHASNYGIIVGRVLANDAFGVPNAKVSVFIPLSNEDSLRTDLTQLYPYKNISSRNSDNIRYNTLPNYSNGECHIPVGTFPKKQLVLDDDSVLEVYDKYYKYTTVTNKSGDYMIFGVPTGNQTIHLDVDLSDIGVLSQRPRDLLYKGYSIDLFDSPTQFKKSTNLDDLAQIISQNATVTVYPFWGDGEINEISITRKDINLQYEFNTTCVFMGSVMTDNEGSIGYSCIPDELCGEASQLVPSEGTIEMIRKTADGRVEEFPIQGNQLIDGNGVFCYQIPMNLDYVGMDEYGNIVPTDNPNKGIATRTRVRFRFTLNETGLDASTTHCARYLVPNNPLLVKDSVIPHIDRKHIEEDFDYSFGTKTPDDQFRDLYWNKVYSIKSYVPRIQRSIHEKTVNYSGIKGVNRKEAKQKTLIPYNRLNLNFKISVYKLLQLIGSEGEDNAIKTFFDFLRSNQVIYDIDTVREAILDELDALGMDFYNDWLNGCLYFPKWYWKVYRKRKVKKGKSAFDSKLCECKNTSDNGKSSPLIFTTYSLPYSNDLEMLEGEDVQTSNALSRDDTLITILTKLFNKATIGTKEFGNGIVKKIVNKDGADIYYYAFGTQTANKVFEDDSYEYVRLFSTDVILLGSLSDCDIDGIPQIGSNIPATTCVIPPMGRSKYEESTDSESAAEYRLVDENGMSWGSKDPRGNYGLFFGIEKPIFMSIRPNSDKKTVLNGERICELGVGNEPIQSIGGFGNASNMHIIYSGGDGLINKDEIIDDDARTLFAILNGNRLIGTVIDAKTGYRKYPILSFNINNFDGKFREKAERYNIPKGATDEPCIDYIDFRMGSREILKSNEDDNEYFSSINRGDMRHFYYVNNGVRYFPLYENSFYFYFGMIPGSTAVDKLYSQYFASCTDNTVFPFTITVTNIEYENACEELSDTHNAKVTINVGEIETPYKILVDGNEYGNGFATPSVQITGLTNGKHEISVVDAVGYMITTTVNVNYVSVTLDAAVTRHIGVEFNGNDSKCDVICNKDTQNFGIIKFNSFTLYGKTYIIESLSGSNGIYTLTADGKCVRIKITPSSGEFTSYMCDCTPGIDEYTGNEVHIYRPDNFNVEIMEMCDGCTKETSNYNNYSLSVNDTRDLEMYINNVPLNFIVGQQENDITKYNGKFHTGNALTTVSDVRGWLGVHDPDNYSFPSTEDSERWFDEGVDPSVPADVVAKKLNSLFSLSNGAYITSNGSHKFDVKLVGADEALLLRSFVPEYGKFSQNSTETVGSFKSFMIDGISTVTCDNENPNIISNNYRYVDVNTLTPIDKVISSESDFNAKYNNQSKSAGNYFAGFSRNADFVNECTVDPSLGEFKRIPYMADDINNSLCKTGSVSNDGSSGLFGRIYQQQTNEHFNESRKYYPYFRTEFVDRRFDYDFLYISPCPATNYEISNEQNSIWRNGRLSGDTYNGIEMAYDKNSGKNFIGSGLEYTVNESDVSWNSSNIKTFYDSTISYADGYDISLLNAYRSLLNDSPSLNDDSGAEIVTDSVSGDEYKNFGLNGDAIVGYPTKRRINIQNIPYGTAYTYSTTSCSYDSLNLLVENDGIKCSARPGETVSHKIQTEGIIVLDTEDFESAYLNKKHNIRYERSGSTFRASSANINFILNPISYDTHFKSKIYENPDTLYDYNKSGIRLIQDSSTFANIGSLKRTSNTGAALTNQINGYSIASVSNLTDVYDTESLKNKKFSLVANSLTGSNLCVIVDRHYYSVDKDSLSKKIRVINMSPIYNAEPFTLLYSYLGQTTENVQDVSVDVNVDIEGESSSGSGEGETGGNKKDKIRFTIKSNYIAQEFAKAAFTIAIEGNSYTYTTGNLQYTPPPTGGTSGPAEIGFTFVLFRHEVSITEASSAICDAYIQMKNGIIIRFNFEFNESSII